MRILLTGGGTGGHTTPLIAVVREIKKISIEKGQPIPEFLYLGPNGFSKELLEKENIKTKIVLAGKLRRYFSFLNFLDSIKLPIGVIQAIWHIFVFMPDVVFSKGGYGSVPGVLASRFFHIPVILHESDTIPGIANKFLSGFANRIAISFAMSTKFFPQNKTALTGNPIRENIARGTIELAKSAFGLNSNKPVIFIFGGSQGAQPINELILQILPDFLEKYELIWQTGITNYEEIIKKTKEILKPMPDNCHIAAFMDENLISGAFAASTLVVSRAGASNIFEIAACAKPSILIPLPNSASDHQRENAFEYAKTGGAIVIEQTNLTPHLFLNEISKLMENSELLQKMAADAKSFAMPDASRKIAEEILKLAIKK
jgi:UDP-N-acetylglucosamine--N-acetylmuramyl-(pentapeptide) pyrophosphoryl-undecaprenol N-acetylglucosamine transferase